MIEPSDFSTPVDAAPEKDGPNYKDPGSYFKNDWWANAGTNQRIEAADNGFIHWEKSINQAGPDATVPFRYLDKDGNEQTKEVTVFRPDGSYTVDGKKVVEEGKNLFERMARSPRGGVFFDQFSGKYDTEISDDLTDSTQGPASLPLFDEWLQDAQQIEGSSLRWEDYVREANKGVEDEEAKVDVDNKELAKLFYQNVQSATFDPSTMGDDEIVRSIGGRNILNPYNLAEIDKVEATINSDESMSKAEKLLALKDYHAKLEEKGPELVEAFAFASEGLGSVFKSDLRSDYEKHLLEGGSNVDFIRENKELLSRDNYGVTSELAAKFRDALLNIGSGALFLGAKAHDKTLGRFYGSNWAELASKPAEALGYLSERTSEAYHNPTIVSPFGIDIKRRDLTELTGQVGSFIATGGISSLGLKGLSAVGMKSAAAHVAKAGVAREVAMKAALSNPKAVKAFADSTYKEVASRLGRSSVDFLKKAATDPTAYLGGVQAAGMSFGRTFDQVYNSTGSRDEAYRKATIDGISDALSATIATGVMNQMAPGMERLLGAGDGKAGASLITGLKGRIASRKGWKAFRDNLTKIAEKEGLSVRKNWLKDVKRSMNAQAAKRGLRGFGIASDMAAEAVEEGMDEALSDVISAMLDDQSTYNEEVWQNISAKFKQYVHAGMLGFIGGAMGGAYPTAAKGIGLLNQSDEAKAKRAKEKPDKQKIREDIDAVWNMLGDTKTNFSPQVKASVGTLAPAATSLAEYLADDTVSSAEKANALVKASELANKHQVDFQKAEVDKNAEDVPDPTAELPSDEKPSTDGEALGDEPSTEEEGSPAVETGEVPESPPSTEPLPTPESTEEVEPEPLPETPPVSQTKTPLTESEKKAPPERVKLRDAVRSMTKPKTLTKVTDEQYQEALDGATSSIENDKNLTETSKRVALEAIALNPNLIAAQVESGANIKFVHSNKLFPPRKDGKPRRKTTTALARGNDIYIALNGAIKARSAKQIAESIRHEILHVAQFAYEATPEGEAAMKAIEALFAEGGDKKLQAKMREEYEGFDNLSPRSKARETADAYWRHSLGSVDGKSKKTIVNFLKGLLRHINKKHPADSALGVYLEGSVESIRQSLIEKDTTEESAPKAEETKEETKEETPEEKALEPIPEKKNKRAYQSILLLAKNDNFQEIEDLVLDPLEGDKHLEARRWVELQVSNKDRHFDKAKEIADKLKGEKTLNAANPNFDPIEFDGRSVPRVVVSPEDLKEGNRNSQWKEESGNRFRYFPREGKSLPFALGTAVQIGGNENEILVLTSIDNNEFVFTKVDLNVALPTALGEKFAGRLGRLSDKWNTHRLANASKPIQRVINSVLADGAPTVSDSKVRDMVLAVARVVLPSFDSDQIQFGPIEGKDYFQTRISKGERPEGISDKEWAETKPTATIHIDEKSLVGVLRNVFASYSPSRGAQDSNYKSLASIEVARHLAALLDEEAIHVAASHEFDGEDDKVIKFSDDFYASEGLTRQIFDQTLNERFKNRNPEDLTDDEKFQMGHELIRKSFQLMKTGSFTEMQNYDSASLISALNESPTGGPFKGMKAVLDMISRYLRKTRLLLAMREVIGRLSDSNREMLSRVDRIYTEMNIRGDVDVDLIRNKVFETAIEERDDYKEQSDLAISGVITENDLSGVIQDLASLVQGPRAPLSNLDLSDIILSDGKNLSLNPLIREYVKKHYKKLDLDELDRALDLLNAGKPDGTQAKSLYERGGETTLQMASRQMILADRARIAALELLDDVSQMFLGGNNMITRKGPAGELSVQNKSRMVDFLRQAKSSSGFGDEGFNAIINHQERRIREAEREFDRAARIYDATVLSEIEDLDLSTPDGFIKGLDFQRALGSPSLEVISSIGNQQRDYIQQPFRVDGLESRTPQQIELDDARWKESLLRAASYEFKKSPGNLTNLTNPTALDEEKAKRIDEIENANDIIKDTRKVMADEGVLPPSEAEKIEEAERGYKAFSDYMKALDEYNSSVINMIGRALGRTEGLSDDMFGLDFQDTSIPATVSFESELIDGELVPKETRGVVDELSRIAGQYPSTSSYMTDTAVYPVAREVTEEVPQSTSDLGSIFGYTVVGIDESEHVERTVGQSEHAVSLIRGGYYPRESLDPERYKRIKSNAGAIGRQLFRTTMLERGLGRLTSEDAGLVDVFFDTAGFNLPKLESERSEDVRYDVDPKKFAGYSMGSIFGVPKRARDFLGMSRFTPETFRKFLGESKYDATGMPTVEFQLDPKSFDDNVGYFDELDSLVDWALGIRKLVADNRIISHIGGHQTIAGRVKPILDFRVDELLKAIGEHRATLTARKDKPINSATAISFFKQEAGTGFNKMLRGMLMLNADIKLTREAYNQFRKPSWRSNVNRELTRYVRDPVMTVPFRDKMKALRERNVDVATASFMEWNLNYIAGPTSRIHLSPIYATEALADFAKSEYSNDGMELFTKPPMKKVSLPVPVTREVSKVIDGKTVVTNEVVETPLLGPDGMVRFDEEGNVVMTAKIKKTADGSPMRQVYNVPDNTSQEELIAYSYQNVSPTGHPDLPFGMGEESNVAGRRNADNIQRRVNDPKRVMDRKFTKWAYLVGMRIDPERNRPAAKEAVLSASRFVNDLANLKFTSDELGVKENLHERYDSVVTRGIAGLFNLQKALEPEGMKTTEGDLLRSQVEAFKSQVKQKNINFLDPITVLRELLEYKAMKEKSAINSRRANEDSTGSVALATVLNEATSFEGTKGEAPRRRNAHLLKDESAVPFDLSYRQWAKDDRNQGMKRVFAEEGQPANSQIKEEDIGAIYQQLQNALDSGKGLKDGPLSRSTDVPVFRLGNPLFKEELGLIAEQNETLALIVKQLPNDTIIYTPRYPTTTAEGDKVGFHVIPGTNDRPAFIYAPRNSAIGRSSSASAIAMALSIQAKNPGVAKFITEFAGSVKDQFDPMLQVDTAMKKNVNFHNELSSIAYDLTKKHGGDETMLAAVRAHIVQVSHFLRQTKSMRPDGDFLSDVIDPVGLRSREPKVIIKDGEWDAVVPSEEGVLAEDIALMSELLTNPRLKELYDLTRFGSARINASNLTDTELRGVFKALAQLSTVIESQEAISAYDRESQTDQGLAEEATSITSSGEVLTESTEEDADFAAEVNEAAVEDEKATPEWDFEAERMRKALEAAEEDDAANAAMAQSIAKLSRKDDLEVADDQRQNLYNVNRAIIKKANFGADPSMHNPRMVEILDENQGAFKGVDITQGDADLINFLAGILEETNKHLGDTPQDKETIGGSDIQRYGKSSQFGAGPILSVGRPNRNSIVAGSFGQMDEVRAGMGTAINAGFRWSLRSNLNGSIIGETVGVSEWIDAVVEERERKREEDKSITAQAATVYPTLDDEMLAEVEDLIGGDLIETHQMRAREKVKSVLDLQKNAKESIANHEEFLAQDFDALRDSEPYSFEEGEEIDVDALVNLAADRIIAESEQPSLTLVEASKRQHAKMAAAQVSKELSEHYANGPEYLLVRNSINRAIDELAALQPRDQPDQSEAATNGQITRKKNMINFQLQRLETMLNIDARSILSSRYKVEKLNRKGKPVKVIRLPRVRTNAEVNIEDTKGLMTNDRMRKLVYGATRHSVNDTSERAKLLAEDIVEASQMVEDMLFEESSFTIPSLSGDKSARRELKELVNKVSNVRIPRSERRELIIKELNEGLSDEKDGVKKDAYRKMVADMVGSKSSTARIAASRNTVRDKAIADRIRQSQIEISRSQAVLLGANKSIESMNRQSVEPMKIGRYYHDTGETSQEGLSISIPIDIYLTPEGLNYEFGESDKVFNDDAARLARQELEEGKEVDRGLVRLNKRIDYASEFNNEPNYDYFIKMDGLRRALADYAENHAEEIYRTLKGDSEFFTNFNPEKLLNRAKATISLQQQVIAERFKDALADIENAGLDASNPSEGLQTVDPDLLTLLTDEASGLEMVEITAEKGAVFGPKLSRQRARVRRLKLPSSTVERRNSIVRLVEGDDKMLILAPTTAQRDLSNRFAAQGRRNPNAAYREIILNAALPQDTEAGGSTPNSVSFSADWLNGKFSKDITIWDTRKVIRDGKEVEEVILGSSVNLNTMSRKEAGERLDAHYRSQMTLYLNRAKDSGKNRKRDSSEFDPNKGLAKEALDRFGFMLKAIVHSDGHPALSDETQKKLTEFLEGKGGAGGFGMRFGPNKKAKGIPESDLKGENYARESTDHFSNDAAIENLDIIDMFSDVFAEIEGNAIMDRLTSGLVVHRPGAAADIGKFMGNYLHHQDARIRSKFLKNRKAFEEAVRMQSILSDGFDTSAGESKSGRTGSEIQKQEMKNRLFESRAAFETKLDIKGLRRASGKVMGSNSLDPTIAYVIASLEGLVQTRFGTLHDNLQKWANSFYQGVRDLESFEASTKKNVSTGKARSKFNQFFTASHVDLLRDKALVLMIQETIAVELQEASKNGVAGDTTHDGALKLIRKMQEKLMAETSMKTEVENYKNELVDIFKEIADAMEVTKAMLSHGEKALGDDELYNKSKHARSKPEMELISTVPMRFGYAGDPRHDLIDTEGRRAEDPLDIVKLEESSLYSRPKDYYYKNPSRAYRPININGLTAVDSVINDSLYRLNVTPTYAALRQVIGRQGRPDENGNETIDPDAKILKLRPEADGSQVGARVTKKWNIALAAIARELESDLVNDNQHGVDNTAFSETLRWLSTNMIGKALTSLQQKWIQAAPAATFIVIKKLAIGDTRSAKDFINIFSKALGSSTLGYFPGMENTYSKNLDTLVRGLSPWISFRSADGIDVSKSLARNQKRYGQGAVKEYAGKAVKNIESLAEWGMDATVGSSERLVARAQYVTELLAELREMSDLHLQETGTPLDLPRTMEDLMPEGDPSKSKWKSGDIPMVAKQIARIKVNDMFGQADQAKKAYMFQNRSKSPTMSSIMRSAVRFSNHTATTSSNLTALGPAAFTRSTVWSEAEGKMVKRHADELRMRRDAIENFVGTLGQNTAFHLMKFHTIIPLILYALAKASGDDDDEAMEKAQKRANNLLAPQDDQNSFMNGLKLFALGKETEFFYLGKDKESARRSAYASLGSKVLMEQAQALPAFGVLMGYAPVNNVVKTNVVDGIAENVFSWGSDLKPVDNPMSKKGVYVYERNQGPIESAANISAATIAAYDYMEAATLLFNSLGVDGVTYMDRALYAATEVGGTRELRTAMKSKIKKAVKNAEKKKTKKGARIIID